MNLPRAFEHIVLTDDGVDIFLMDSESGEVFQANATAARIFSFCQRALPLDEAVAALAAGLGAAGQEAEIRQDIQHAVGEFQVLGLVEGGAASTPA